MATALSSRRGHVGYVLVRLARSAFGEYATPERLAVVGLRVHIACRPVAGPRQWLPARRAPRA